METWYEPKRDEGSSKKSHLDMRYITLIMSHPGWEYRLKPHGAISYDSISLAEGRKTGDLGDRTDKGLGNAAVWLSVRSRAAYSWLCELIEQGRISKKL